MQKRLVLWGSLAVLALITLFVSVNGSVNVNAQSGLTPKTATPQPTPANNGGTAKWTIKSETFKSNYPKGVQFTIDVSSSGGKIVSAAARWKHGISDNHQAAGKIDASGMITASSPPSEGVPQWVAVEHWWSLVDEAGNTLETNHKFDEYSDNTRKWKRGESEDVVVFAEEGVPDDVIPTVLQGMKDHRARYFRLWGRLLNYRPRAIIYANFDPWQEWNPQAAPIPGMRTFVAGQTSETWGGTVQVYLGNMIPNPTEDIADSVFHEFGHLYQFQNGIAPFGTWFVEGDADFNANGRTRLAEAKQYVARLISEDNLPSLQGDGPSIAGNDALDGYYIGFLFFNWIEQTYGQDAHLKIWTQIGNGKSIEDAIQSVTNMNLVDTDTAFRKWLGLKNPVAPTPIELPTLEFPPTKDYSITSTPIP